MRSPTRVQHYCLARLELRMRQAVERNPFGNRNVVGLEIRGIANIHDPETGLSVPDPSCELYRGHVIVLVFHSTRKARHVERCSAPSWRSSKDSQSTKDERDDCENTNDPGTSSRIAHEALALDDRCSIRSATMNPTIATTVTKKTINPVLTLRRSGKVRLPRGVL